MTLSRLTGRHDVADLVEEFDRDGHVCVRGLAAPEEVGAYRPALESTAMAQGLDPRPMAERDTYSQAFLQVHNLWERDETCREFVFSPRFAAVAAQLLGVDGVRLYHDQALFKEPGGGRTPWHQDMNYWPLDTDRTVTMWMPLVDIGGEVGSMTFASGSHRLGDIGAGDISDSSEAAIEARIAAGGLRTATHGPMRAGDASFHHGWVLHGAGPNPTETMRSVMTVIYVADGTRVSRPTDRQRFDLQMWLGGRGPGDLVDSPMNPLLWPA